MTSHHAVPLLLGLFVQSGEGDDAGVVDEDVEGSEFRERGFGEAFGVVVARDVGFYCDELAGQTRSSLEQGRVIFGLDATGDHGSTLAGEEKSGGFADAAAGAGDDGYFVLESQTGIVAKASASRDAALNFGKRFGSGLGE